MCLECSNSTFNNKRFLQGNGTAQGPHMSCPYSDTAIQYSDVKALVKTESGFIVRSVEPGLGGGCD